MLNRLVFGSSAVLILLTIVVSDAYIADKMWESRSFSPLVGRGSLIPLAMTSVVVLALMEVVCLLRAMGCKPHAGWAMLSCVVLMLSPWLCAGGVLGDSPVDVEALQWQLVWLVIAMLGAVVVHLPRGVTRTAVGDLAATWFVVIYLGLLPSFVVHMRCDVNIAVPSDGAWHVLIVLTVAFASDIGALYVGRAFGRHKLAPSISPGKSIEGFVGGIAGSAAAMILLSALAARTHPRVDEAITAGEHLAAFGDQFTHILERMTFTQAIVFAVVISISSQIGDLFESIIKRTAQVKHSSGLVPGMGGVLDVIDGTLFAVPVAWLLLTKVWGLV